MKQETKIGYKYPCGAQKAFTLIDLLTLMAIGGFLMTVAIPSYSVFAKNNLQTASANSLLDAVTMARSEAVSRNARASVCQSSDGLVCGTSGWGRGWILFLDSGEQGEVDGDDSVLRVFDSLAEGTTLTSDSFKTYISYASDGTSNESGGYQMCDSRGASSAKSLCVSAVGRAQILSEACTGGEISCP